MNDLDLHVEADLHVEVKVDDTLPALSMLTALYTLSLITSIFCFLMGFAAVLGPLFVIIPWTIFYGIKKKLSYFRHWTWLALVYVLIGSSLLGFIIFYCIMMMFFAVYINLTAVFFIILFMIWNLIYSVLLMKRGMSQKKRSSQYKPWKLSLLITIILGFGFIYTYVNDHCGLSSMARSGSIISTRVLLVMNTDINGAGCYNTPLMAASHNPEMIKFLLTKGADVHLSNRWGLSALHQARGRQSVEVASLLIKASAEIDTPDRHGKTPIFHAIQNKDKKLVQFLIQQGANVSHQDHQGNTPLHLVASQMKELIQSLIQAGANTLITNNKGKTPLESMKVK